MKLTLILSVICVAWLTHFATQDRVMRFKFSTDVDSEQKQLAAECEKIVELINKRDWSNLSSYLSPDYKRLFYLRRMYDGMDTKENVNHKEQIYQDFRIDEKSYVDFMEGVQLEIDRKRDNQELVADPNDLLAQTMSVEVAVFTKMVLEYPEFEKIVKANLVYANRKMDLKCQTNVERVELHDSYAVCFVGLIRGQADFPIGQIGQLKLFFVKVADRWLLSQPEFHQQKQASPLFVDFREKSLR